MKMLNQTTMTEMLTHLNDNRYLMNKIQINLLLTKKKHDRRDPDLYLLNQFWQVFICGGAL